MVTCRPSLEGCAVARPWSRGSVTLQAFVWFALVCSALAEHQHGARRGVHSLDVNVAGDRIHILLGEYTDDSGKPALNHLRSDDAGATWSAPVRVDRGLPHAHSAHRGMDAQIAAAGDRLIAVWMSPGTDKWGGGPMTTALSHDAGKTWQPGPNPADDASTAGHGFIDCTADRIGSFHLVWLDDRAGRRGLRYATSDDGGVKWFAHQTAAEPTCECCPNTLAIGADGAARILFRDYAPRDMSLAILDGKSAPVRVGDFGWKFDGCPHVGGGLAVGAALHAAVWTGRADRAGVHHLKSLDGGRTWSEPRMLGDGTASHPDIAAIGKNDVAAAWDAATEAGRAIFVSRSSDAGASWSGPRRLSASGAQASHPRIVGVGGRFRVFWTEIEGEKPAVWRSAEVD